MKKKRTRGVPWSHTCHIAGTIEWHEARFAKLSTRASASDSGSSRQIALSQWCPPPDGSGDVRQKSRGGFTDISGVRSPQIQISVPHFPRAMWRPTVHPFSSPATMRPSIQLPIPGAPRTIRPDPRPFLKALHFPRSPLKQIINSKECGSDHVKKTWLQDTLAIKREKYGVI